jgi:CBS domain-containing protein
VYGYVRDVLAEKGSQVFTVSLDATVREAVAKMNARGVGALVVSEFGEVAGIFTERDVLRRVVDPGLDPNITRVRSVMSSPVRMITLSTRVADAMETMTRERVRHLPVMAGGELAGMISIGDLLRRVTRTQEDSITHMTEYIIGRA